MKTPTAQRHRMPSSNGEAENLAPPASKTRVTIAPPKLLTMKFVVRGITPLVMNNFSNRAKEKIQAKQGGVVLPKNFRVPQAEFFDSLYITPDGEQFYMKPNAFKRAICDASRLVEGVPGTLLGQALHVVDPYVIVYGSLPRMIEPVHRIGKWPNQTAMIQYRGELSPWVAEMSIRWLGNVLSVEQVAYLLMYAGMGGVGDCRPNSKSNKGGTYGQFEVVPSDEQAAVLSKAVAASTRTSTAKWIKQQAAAVDEAIEAAMKLLETESPKGKKK